MRCLEWLSSTCRISGEDQLGLWQHLEDELNVEIEFVYLPPEDYASGLASGNLPDIVSTNNSLSTIVESELPIPCTRFME
ncbi:MAG: hypothetical protein IKG18_07735 [Atopobiaceae bacterium]|nr:hypothetical protein [Atopobiaceae bacterium]